MKKVLFFVTVLVATVVGAARISLSAERPVVDLAQFQDVPRSATETPGIERVALGGKINHFGIPDYHATVPGVKVWIAEYPSTKDSGIVSGENGWWETDVLKYEGTEIGISLVYEKEGWISTKSNVISVKDSDDPDLAIQFIDPDYFHDEILPMTEAMLSMLLPGEKNGFRNAMVATVGKSWASMHDDRLPHGDPGATATKVEGAVGPVYFNEKVNPDPQYRSTSVDGGVAWINVPPGVHFVTASKEGVEYGTVEFRVEPGDAETGIILYIASPPDSIRGSNDSPPGEP